MKNIKPSATGGPQDVRIKVRINDNGLILVTSACIVEKKPKEPEPSPPAAGDNAAPENGNNMDTTEVSHTHRINMGFLLFYFIGRHFHTLYSDSCCIFLFLYLSHKHIHSIYLLPLERREQKSFITQYVHNNLDLFPSF